MAQPQHSPDQPWQAREVREAVGAFHSVEALDRAVEDLLSSGFDVAEVTLLAEEQTASSKFGHRLRDTRAAGDDPTAPRRAWAEPESRMEGKGALSGVLGYIGAVAIGGVTFATGGTALAAVALGVLAGGASAAAGLRLANAFEKPRAESLQRQIEAGGVLVFVKLRDEAHAQRASAILERHGATDVHVHRFAEP